MVFQNKQLVHIDFLRLLSIWGVPYLFRANQYQSCSVKKDMWKLSTNDTLFEEMIQDKVCIIAQVVQYSYLKRSIKSNWYVSCLKIRDLCLLIC